MAKRKNTKQADERQEIENRMAEIRFLLRENDRQVYNNSDPQEPMLLTEMAELEKRLFLMGRKEEEADA